MDDAIKRALDKAAQSWCCGLAACHYEDCGMPCQMRDHPRMAAAIAAFLRALPADLEIDSDWRRDKTEMGALAAAIERAAGGGA